MQMEDLNNNIMNLIFNLQDLRMQQKANAAKMPEKDAYGYPFEPFDCFSTEPASFLEKVMMLDTEAVEIFRQLRELNRHSPLFYQMSSDMEKIVSQLGSACITKAVIEQERQNSSTMDQLLKRLNIDHLREWTAFNLRKCFASFMESSSTLRYNKIALNLSVRWSVLDKRLIATAEKIEKIKSGQLRVGLTDKAEQLEKAADPEKKTEDMQKNTAPLHVSGRSLPVDKASVHDTLADGLQDSTPAEPEEEVPENTSEYLNTEEKPVTAESAEYSEDKDENLFDENDDSDLPMGREEWIQNMAGFFIDPNLVKLVLPEYAAAPP